ncbi:MAG: GTPase, partial [Cellulomonas sp.]
APVEQGAEARRTSAAEAASDWVLTADQAVRALVTSDDRHVSGRAARAARALGEHGLAVVALAAAAGIARADELLTAVLPASGTGLSTRLRDDLATRAAQQVGQEGAAILAGVLDSPDLAPDAASVLRLRLAVLKGLS